MILKTDDRTYTCTTCRHTKGICLQGLHVIQTLSRAVARGLPMLSPDFQMEGCVRMAGCNRPCMAVFRVTPDDLHLFCDVDADAQAADLARFADIVLSEGATAQAGLKDLVQRGIVPAALVISSPLTPGAAMAMPAQ